VTCEKEKVMGFLDVVSSYFFHPQFYDACERLFLIPSCGHVHRMVAG
jgi:hypothetical protein